MEGEERHHHRVMYHGVTIINFPYAAAVDDKLAAGDDSSATINPHSGASPAPVISTEAFTSSKISLLRPGSPSQGLPRIRLSRLQCAEENELEV